MNINQEEGYITVTLDGKLDQTILMAMPDTIRAECDKRGCKSVLIDCLLLSGTGLSTSQRFFIGKKIARVMSGIKLAVVWPAKDIDGFAERVATNRGGRIIVTSDLEHARQWLLLDPED